MALRGLDFVAFDFETATSDSASACSIGAVKIQDGMVTDAFSTLIYPPTGLAFSAWNVRIHGIRPEHVEQAPDWPDVADRFFRWIAELPLVAHNAQFDMSVLRNASRRTGVDVPTVKSFCTVRLAQRLLPQLPNHKLPTVFGHISEEGFNHHEALADAQACARIVQFLAEREDTADMEQLWAKGRQTYSRPGYSRYRSSSSYRGSSTYRGGAASSWGSTGRSSLPKPNVNADPSNPLYAQVICFSGELESLSREDAQKLAADRGSIVANSVTKRTTILVVGSYQSSGLGAIKGERSAKHQKALDYLQAGQELNIISETDFVTFLGR